MIFEYRICHMGPLWEPSDFGISLKNSHAAFHEFWMRVRKSNQIPTLTLGRFLFFPIVCINTHLHDVIVESRNIEAKCQRLLGTLGNSPPLLLLATLASRESIRVGAGRGLIEVIRLTRAARQTIDQRKSDCIAERQGGVLRQVISSDQVVCLSRPMENEK